jgi:hypothetical protein
MSDYDNDGIYTGYDWLPRGYEKPAVCECGIDITMGKDADVMFHSDWCPKRIKKEKEEKEKHDK